MLALTKRAYELFISSEVEERRQLIKLVLSNVELTDGNIVYKAYKPFDLILNSTDRRLWRQSRGTLRTFNWRKLRERLKLIMIQEAKISLL